MQTSFWAKKHLPLKSSKVTSPLSLHSEVSTVKFSDILFITLSVLEIQQCILTIRWKGEGAEHILRERRVHICVSITEKLAPSIIASWKKLHLFQLIHCIFKTMQYNTPIYYVVAKWLFLLNFPCFFSPYQGFLHCISAPWLPLIVVTLILIFFCIIIASSRKGNKLLRAVYMCTWLHRSCCKAPSGLEYWG